MPKPKGWTQQQVDKRDEIAKAMIRAGAASGLAYGTATNEVKTLKQQGKRVRLGKKRSKRG